MLIHQSDLSALSRCAAQAGYRLKGMRSDTNSAAAYGSVMHSALHVLEQKRAEGVAFEDCVNLALEHFLWYWSPLHIESICDPVPADGWLPRQGYSELRARGVDAIRKYADLIRYDDHELLAIEYGFIVPIEGTWDDDLGRPHDLGGSVDRLAIRHYSRKAAIAVDDWKTGKEQARLRHNLQFTAYTVLPETPILMSDLTWLPIGEVQVGDEIMAVDEHPIPRVAGVNRRHWRKATVEAVWSVTKPSWCVTFSDGTTLTTGEGHRLLCQREGAWAWRTVEDISVNLHNPRRKAAGIKVARVLPSTLHAPSVDYNSTEYMAGYIAGATLGDGCIRAEGKQPYWQILLGATDVTLLDRLRSYLSSFGITVSTLRREPNGKGWQKSLTVGLGTHARTKVEQIKAMCDSPGDTDAYAAGWLAGLYDTDGGLHKASGTISVYQEDRDVLNLVVKRAASLGFTFRHCAKSVELVGDRMERVRFMAMVQPALQRKVEQMDGRTLRMFGDCRVVRIERAGEQRLCDITTSTGTYIADGIVSHNCYASTRPEFWIGNGGEDGFGAVRGAEIYERTKEWGRRGTWINMRKFKFEDAGWRGPIDYHRFAVAVEQYVATVKADIFPLTISGEVCKYCEYRKDICAGTGIAPEAHGDPTKGPIR